LGRSYGRGRGRRLEPMTAAISRINLRAGLLPFAVSGAAPALAALGLPSAIAEDPGPIRAAARRALARLSGEEDPSAVHEAFLREIGHSYGGAVPDALASWLTRHELDWRMRDGLDRWARLFLRLLGTSHRSSQVDDIAEGPAAWPNIRPAVEQALGPESEDALNRQLAATSLGLRAADPIDRTLLALEVSQPGDAETVDLISWLEGYAYQERAYRLLRDLHSKLSPDEWHAFIDWAVQQEGDDELSSSNLALAAGS